MCVYSGRVEWRGLSGQIGEVAKYVMVFFVRLRWSELSRRLTHLFHLLSQRRNVLRYSQSIYICKCLEGK